MARKTALLTLAVAVCSSALGKDAIQASVTPLNTPVPLVTANGNPYSAGTYAVGTIQLWYTVNAYQFPAGPFASFELNMIDANYSAKPPAAYPVDLKIGQLGSSNLLVTPTASSFTITAPGWEGTSRVSVEIPQSTVTNPALNADGTDLVANIQLVTDPNGAGVDTVTNVQVHIILVHPTSCMRVFNFFTDPELEHLIETVQVNVTGKAENVGLIPGQLSDNVLVVNGCADSVALDLAVTLDPLFEPGSNGNPVKTLSAAGSVAPMTFLEVVFGAETPRGTNLCISNLQVAAGTTLLAAVQTGMLKDATSGSLPTGNAFEFSAKLTEPDASCGGGEALSIAVPNPVSVSLPFTKQSAGK
ncbi:MAG TPA: hypothetical protein VN428_09030 [Bryobacteraceae bacterium]|nr:hypothetical protein [Bryobacteraceae bacterium]